jgi:hypothetical protein
VAVAIAAIFLLPDHPLTTRWLTPEQRELAHSRMERDTVGLQESRGAIAGFKQALTDPRLALFVLFQTLHMVRVFCQCIEWYTDALGCLWIQFVLPHCGQNARLFHHSHFGYGKLFIHYFVHK